MKETNPAAKIIAAVLIVVSFCMVFMGWLSEYYISFSFFDMVKMLLDYGANTTQAVILLIIAALLVLTAIIGVIHAIKGKKAGPVLYLIVAIAAFIYFVVAANQAGAGLSILGLGAWACPILALVAVICMNVPQK